MRKACIVLIDNDQANLEFLENLIYKARPSSRCISFIFGDEAVEAVCNEFLQVPQYIFINANLRRTSGTRCLETFRGDRRFIHCCICIFSTCMPEALGDTYKSMGADFAFQFPISNAEALAKLTDILHDPSRLKSIAC